MEYVSLNNGVKMPMAGIGVFMMSPAEAQSAVENALKSGVRLIEKIESACRRKVVLNRSRVAPSIS